MSGEITETAKAAQEVAKATQQGIAATENIASFFAPYVKESVESIFGILADRLRFVRWRGQLRFVDKVEKIIKERELEKKLNTIPLKFALPIIENATIEENDDLQCLWVSLLVASGISEKEVKVGFISILKQLDPIDAKILKAYYDYAIEKLNSDDKRILYQVENNYYSHGSNFMKISYVPVNINTISLGVDKKTLRCSLDNLIRLRMLAEFVEEDTLDIPDNDMRFYGYQISRVNKDYFYITALGEEFMKACQ